MNWIEILGAVGVPALVGTIIPFLVTRKCNKKDKKEEEQDNTTDRLDELEHNVDEATESYQKDLILIKDNFERVNNILSILKNAEQALLRDRIIQAYNHYYINKKFMPIYARESIEHMYQEYKNLGGNGVIDALIEKLYSLPTESIDGFDE